MQVGQSRGPRMSSVFIVFGSISICVAVFTVVGPIMVLWVVIASGQLFALDDTIFRRRLGVNCVLDTEHREIGVILCSKEGSILVPAARHPNEQRWPTVEPAPTSTLTEIVVSGKLIAGRETFNWPPYESYFLLHADQGTVVADLTKNELADAWRASTNTLLPPLNSIDQYRPHGDWILVAGALAVLADILVFFVATICSVFFLIMHRHYRRLESGAHWSVTTAPAPT